MKKFIFSIVIAAGMVFGLSSCEGFLDRMPTDSVVSETAMATLYDAGVVVNGLYTPLKYYTMYGSWWAYMGDMRADNIYPRQVSGTGNIFYCLDYDSEANTYFGFWNNYYNVIMRANSIIENIETLPASGAAQVAQRNDYLGQAHAIRALCYFDLARLYGYPYLKDKGASLGAVILETVASPSEARIPRKTVAETYALVQKDLETAVGLLSKQKNTGHFNYWAARLLQARVHLYKGEYANAYTCATEVINNSPYKLATYEEYLDYWGREGHDESVLELLVTVDSDIDPDGGFYTIYHNMWFDDKNAGGSVIPTRKWRNLFKDTPNDVRGQMIAFDDPVTGARQSGDYWLRKFIGNKDRVYTFRRNNPRVMRITEAYLIAAEAALETNKASDANNYLNRIRKRADPTASNVTATLDLIQLERQKEFIGEGHRFFDVMRRGGTITRDPSDPHEYAVGSGYKQSFSWDYEKVVLPISHTERLLYPELQQNPGYKD
ncbi:MAG: RagB/SusD family nutrient uptake outer membrane protein [Bacteroidales bacterium]|nr:RagB/SusD family nutrient uptake outer membrane protein [Bacteroidales bacterium]HPH53132.1 RagB/SusD family nutrient uptake outer membrane protein [Bacteroidales bacterium]